MYGTNTYQISNVPVLFEFHPSELSHVDPGGGIWYVVGAANNIPPQRQDFLSLNKLHDGVNKALALVGGTSSRGRVQGGFFLALAAEKAASWLSLHIHATSPLQCLSQLESLEQRQDKVRECNSR